jgi:hydroxyacylglutathione hydrolase
LKSPTRESFIAEVTAGILPPPQYFAKNAAINKNGYTSFTEVKEKGLIPMGPADFEAAVNDAGALILDTRDPQEFAKGFIPSSINIGLGGQFAPWVGALITDLQQPLLLIVDPDKAEEAITRLARVGYDSTIGYLQGGIAAWVSAGKETDTISSISVADFETLYQQDPLLKTLDVRKPGEYESGHLDFSLPRPLDYINDWTNEVKPGETYYIHCAGGYRSMIAASILKARGANQVIDIAGGYAAIKSSGLSRTDGIGATH